jgi:hypothetical protein
MWAMSEVTSRRNKEVGGYNIENTQATRLPLQLAPQCFGKSN